MRKYYMSHVDFSEIETISKDETTREIAMTRLTEGGALNAKGKPDAGYMRNLSETFAPPFFAKLQRRLSRRRGGIGGAYEIFSRLQSGKEYTAMYLYLVILYGFLEWQVPQMVAQLPVVPEALKAFLTAFMEDFSSFMANMETAETESSVEDESE